MGSSTTSSAAAPAAATPTATTGSTTTTAAATRAAAASARRPAEALAAGVTAVAEGLRVAPAAHSAEGARLACLATTASAESTSGLLRRSRAPTAALAEATTLLAAKPALLRASTLLTEAALSSGATEVRSLTAAAAKRLARLCVGRSALVEPLLGGLVSVLDALAVFGAVLPFAPVPPTSTSGAAAVAVLDAVAGLVAVVDVSREVVRLAVVDVDVTAAPVAVAPERRPDRRAGEERECPGGEPPYYPYPPTPWPRAGRWRLGYGRGALLASGLPPAQTPGRLG